MKTHSTHKSGRALKIIGIIALVLLLGTGTYYFLNPRKAISFAFPDLNKISYVDARIKNDSLFTKISIILENKNFYSIHIDSLYFKLRLNDTPLVNQFIPINIRQKYRDVDSIDLPLNLNIKKVRKTIAHLQGTDSTDLQIDGYIVYQTIFGKKRFDIHKKSRMEVPIPPQIKVLKVERKDFSLKERTLTVNVTAEIINKGKNLNLELSEIEYEFTVKSTLHSKGKITKPIMVKPESSTTVTLPIVIEIMHPLKTAVLIGLDKDRLPYELHLTGNLKENISNNSFNSPTEITANGMLELKK